MQKPPHIDWISLFLRILAATEKWLTEQYTVSFLSCDQLFLGEGISIYSFFIMK